MGFKIFIIVCNFIIPAIMLFFGARFKKCPPKNINGIYGYRTNMSMKNKDTWQFAHKYCGKLWIKLGLIMLTISIICNVFVLVVSNNIQVIILLVLLTIQSIVLVASIFPIEKALENNFNINGDRKK